MKKTRQKPIYHHHLRECVAVLQDTYSCCLLISSMSAFSVLLWALRALSISFSNSVRWAFFIASMAEDTNEQNIFLEGRTDNFCVKCCRQVVKIPIRPYFFLQRCVQDQTVQNKRSFGRQLPAMVAAVSSASSRSFSSCRFSSSLWCFLCNSSITFWWDSSIAAKPLSHVACQRGKHSKTVSSEAQGTWAQKGSCGKRTLWGLRSRVGG